LGIICAGIQHLLPEGLHCSPLLKLVTMSGLDERLAAMLADRKGKGRFRQLREYDTSSSSDLIDFVSVPHRSRRHRISIRIVKFHDAS